MSSGSVLFAENHRERPVRAVKPQKVPVGYLQGSQRAVVVVDRFNGVAAALNQRPPGGQLCVRIRKLEANRRGCQYLESLRVAGLQDLSSPEAVRKHARSPFAAAHHTMEDLQSGHRFAVWIIGVQSKGDA